MTPSKCKISVIVIILINLSLITNSQIHTCDIIDKSQLEYIVKLYAPSEDAFIAVQKLAKPLIDKKDYKGAAQFYQSQMEKFPELKDRFLKIIGLLNAPSKGIEIHNLGGAINTLYKEYGPVISPDGKKLYFTTMEREEAMAEKMCSCPNSNIIHGR